MPKTANNFHFFCNEPIGTYGPMTYYDVSMFSALANSGVKVTWITNQIGLENLDPFQPSFSTKVSIYPAFKRMYAHKNKALRGMIYILGMIKSCIKMILSSKREHVIYFQQFSVLPPLEIAAVKILKLFHIKCILAPHDVEPFKGSLPFHHIMPRLYREFDKIVLHSKYATDEFIKTFPDMKRKTRFIPHGHLCDRGSSVNKLSRNSARKLINLPEDIPIILFIGQIKEEKGLDVLLKAMAVVHRTTPNVRLMIAGRPFHCDANKYTNMINTLGLNNIIATRWDFIPEDDLDTYYTACNIVILPYKKVYQSGVVLTSYAFNRPVITSDIGGFKEQVKESATGYFFKSEDPESLAETISMAISDTNKLDTMGYTGNEWARKNFRWSTIALDIIKIAAE